MKRNILTWAGAALLIAGTVILLAPTPLDESPHNVSYNSTGANPEEESGPNYLGWGTLTLGFLMFGSSSYFKLRDARRADRAESREIQDRRRSSDDIA